MINMKFKLEDGEEVNIYTDTPLDFAIALVQAYECGYMEFQDKKSIEDAVRMYNLRGLVRQAQDAN